MSAAAALPTDHAAGLWMQPRPGQTLAGLQHQLFDWLASHGLEERTVQCHADESGHGLRLRLTPEALAAWAPGFDTLELAATLRRDGDSDDAALAREIVVAMLAAPQPMAFDGMDELQARVGVRGHIVRAAARTALAFRTDDAAERPADFWHYDEEHGFLLHEGRPLIDALRAATQPEATGRRYDFSCYRATEYVILLGIAQELALRNPALLEAVTRASRRRAIRSGAFHEVFLTEFGSLAQPVPPRYYVPGARVWFRNPHAGSADVEGYEGSWVIYLGGGRFSNFWQRERPYGLDDKCVEIHHWRHGVEADADGALRMNEGVVERRTAATLAHPARRAAVLARMQRLRDPQGVYAAGGCIDATREFPRPLCPGTSTIALPALA
ncbi:hypothetical protein [Ottowia sp.]|uniref:hypothetical protein n=1 Tax=Ottowia sp. TaxID=1898956 RepID=UPI0025E83DDA|nr:hypothetical protein [Ottowia sp.]